MPHQWEEGWECPLCSLTRGKDGHDPCIANLPGVLAGCCGHGDKGQNEPYLYFANGVRIGFIVTSIFYDDGREQIIVPAEQIRNRLAWVNDRGAFIDGQVKAKNKAIETANDWFTLPPTLRTKKKLLEMLREG